MNIFHLTIIRINTVQINDYILNNIRTFTIIILGNNILIISIDSFGETWSILTTISRNCYRFIIQTC